MSLKFRLERGGPKSERRGSQDTTCPVAWGGSMQARQLRLFAAAARNSINLGARRQRRHICTSAKPGGRGWQSVTSPVHSRGQAHDAQAAGQDAIRGGAVLAAAGQGQSKASADA